MSSWYSSWFAGLPAFDFTVPSSIQRRFFSFLLKRTLGRFLKPGQLDLHQIDSQLGSGTVRVKDLELDGQAINQLLAGLPLSLYDGFISGVTVRIPFPNPLSSSVGLHVQSLNLTFQITPEQFVPLHSPSSHGGPNLADSVASVAETFIHDELTPREEATLRQTLRPFDGLSPPVDESENLPGGFNPFGYNLQTEPVYKGAQGDDDPAGVSIFATLIERLLAKFEFSAVDTKVTVVYPSQASFTLSVPEIAYRTDPSPNVGLQTISEANSHCGQIRTVSISDLKVTSRDLRVTGSTPTVTGTLSPVSSDSSRNSLSQCHTLSPSQLSRSSSRSSSMDEETQFMMSQSIAMLPPGSPAPPSASSSMYQSAISASHAQSTEVDMASALRPTLQIADNTDNTGRARSRHRISVSCQDTVEDVILSLGSQPITVSLQTPSRPMQTSEPIQPTEGDHMATSESFVRDISERETLKLSVRVGMLACAFRSDHLRTLLDIVDACVPKPPAASRVSRKGVSSESHHTGLCLEADVVVRGIVIVALLEPTPPEALSLDAFYARPHVPPRLPCSYLRLFFDALSISFQHSTPSADLSEPSLPRTSLPVQVDCSASAKVVVSDVSLFAFHGLSSLEDSQTAMPILITDHYLPTLHGARHYRPSFASERPRDIKLPGFEVVDWTQARLKSGSAKLSTWRLRKRMVHRKANEQHTPSQGLSDLPSSPNPFVHSPLSDVEDTIPPPAIEVSGQLVLPTKETPCTVDVKISPFRLFFDLGMIFEGNLLMRFAEDVASSTIFIQKRERYVGRENACQQSPEESGEDHMDMDKDLRMRLMTINMKEREEERKRLEALVLEDLNMGIDYQRAEASEPKSCRKSPSLPKRKKMVPKELGPNLCLMCPMIRIEIRCPPPPPHLPRSGCMLFDFRDLAISNDTFPTKSSLRFSEGMKSSPSSLSDSTSNVVLRVRLQEVLAAYSPVGDNVAHAMLTLGFLPGKEVGPNTGALLATEMGSDTLLSVTLGRSNIAKQATSNPSSRVSVTIDVPLVNLMMDKTVFDGLQYWADDVAQLMERSFRVPDSATETLSRNSSLIGSRYFTRSRHSGTHSTDENVVDSSNTGETVVKVNVMEALIRLCVPRNGESCHARPFDVFILDADALIELKPEGKEETVITAGIMDLRIVDTSCEGDYVILVQSPARALSSPPRSSVKSRITSFTVPETTAKESRIKLTFWGLTVYPPFDGGFGDDLAVFAKAPSGVFESVVPSERTRLTIRVIDVSIHLHAPGYPGAAVLYLGEAELLTELVGNSSGAAFKLSVSSSHVFLVDSVQDAAGSTETTPSPPDRSVDFWKDSGYALIAEIVHSQLAFQSNNAPLPPSTKVTIERIGLRIRLCADTISALTGLITHITRAPKDDAGVRLSRTPPGTPNTATGDHEHDMHMTASLDEHAFRIIPEVGSTADMIFDDLPVNQDYLDESFGTAAGLRELRDDDLEDFDLEGGHDTPVTGQLGIVSNVGGETVRILRPFSVVEHYFDTISPDIARDPDSDTTLRIRIYESDITLFLHDGFDWPRTRKIIEKEVKEMRKKLARIRQLVATGQTQEPIDETTSAMLFNSFHIGLERDLESMDPDTLIAAIDDELEDSTETGTESSWQSLQPASPGRPRIVSMRIHGRRLTRSKGPSIEIRMEGLNAEIDNYRPGDTLVSRTLILVRDLEILDHIKTSTWKKFLTNMRSDARGNVRETESDMARVELLTVRPSSSHSAEEARLRAKILPLRLYVDQDALDFLKKFFAFQDPDSPSAPEDGEKKEEIYFQHAEVFPVDIKLDYKPRRVDYRALRDGRTIELMNFFHFDGAEMTLRHLTLHGITGWPRFFDTLNDLWTPDVKATQLVDVISGVAPIRSVVNVGSGVADLVLLPIAQYKKDGRIVRGVQKGTKAFIQSTAMEAIKLGARLATGTQVILEQAENVLGGQFKDPITAEALQIPYESEGAEGSDEDLISRYATQPTGLKEGVQSAYRSLQKNLHSAAQTILAVPMEVYERSGNEGAVKAVVRAVPIAVLKPMIGASEAVSKTLMGLHNTLDPNIRLENEAKYKHR